MTDTTVTTDPPTGNSPEARTGDGTLKDQTPPTETTTPTPPEKKPEGGSFLTQTPLEKKEGEPDPKAKEGDGKAPEGDKKPDAEGAPEKYADFKVPEGFKFDEKALLEATTAFKELGLSQ